MVPTGSNRYRNLRNAPFARQKNLFGATKYVLIVISVASFAFLNLTQLVLNDRVGVGVGVGVAVVVGGGGGGGGGRREIEKSSDILFSYEHENAFPTNIVTRQHQHHHDASSPSPSRSLDNTGKATSQSTGTTSAYVPKTYPPRATLASPWNQTKGFIQLQRGRSGRTLIMNPWEEVHDMDYKRNNLPPYGTRESGVVSCEDGTQIIIGGYNADYSRVRSIMQILPQAGRRSTDSVNDGSNRSNPWYTVDLPNHVGQTHQGATCHDMKVYVVSGQHGDGCGPSTTKVARYDIVRQSWTSLPDLPAGRYIPGVAVVGNILHVFRGASENRYEGANNHWVLDLTDTIKGWQEQRPLPHSQAGGHPWVFASVDGTAIYTGGVMWGDAPAVRGPHRISRDCHDKPDGYVDRRIFRFDTTTGEWKEMKHRFPMDTSHILQTAIQLEGIGIAMGGAAKSGTRATEASSWLFDESSGRWSRGYPMPRKIKGQPAIVDYTGRLSAILTKWVKPEVEASVEVANITQVFFTQLTVAEPLESYSRFARMQVLRPPAVGLGAKVRGKFVDQHFTTDVVTPVILNLADRPDRLFRIIKEMHKLQWHCFVRFDALTPTVEEAKSIGIIDYDQLSVDFEWKKKHEKWWKRWVNIDYESFYRAHVGVKLSMVEIFRLAAAESHTNQIENMFERAGCRRRHPMDTEPTVSSRPILIVEDDSIFIHLDESVLRRALDDLKTVPKWHLLFISYRNEIDFPITDQVPNLKEVVRVREVLGNTAMIVNPTSAQDLLDIFGSKSTSGLSATMDHLMKDKLMDEEIVIYRLKDRMVVPDKSMSSIHGTKIIYGDTKIGMKMARSIS